MPPKNKSDKTFNGLGMLQLGYPTKQHELIHKIAVDHKYGVVESFSGAGGISLGLEWAGFEVLLAFDADKYAVQTHQINLKGKGIEADARKITGNEIRQVTDLGRKDLALFTGGPPCQGFSKQKRNAHLGDNRNDLVMDYLRLVRELNPRFFMFENVAIFGQKRGKQYIDEMFKQFKDYRLYPHFYNAADYGLPQTRQRFIMIGKRRDQKSSFIIPQPTFSNWRTVGEVLANIPEPPSDYSVHPSYPNHQNARVTAINIERFSHVPQGGGWMDIPNAIRMDCHKDGDTSKGGWPDVFGRLRWDGQCPTITGGFDSFTRGRYGHPLKNRPLTPREAARIQGFPDYFAFAGTRGEIRKQIGNAVPPPLAEAIGLEILRSLLCADDIIPDLHNNSENEQLELAT